MEDEYTKLMEVILTFDGNLLTIKGWGVTFGLATIALAFKEKVRGMFLTAALAAVCFWVLEAEFKWHQSNYYYRMNQIEIDCQDNEIANNASCPKVDWSWREAARISTPFLKSKGSTVQEIEIPNRLTWYIQPHVLLPHILVLIVGVFLFRKSGFDRWVGRQKANKTSHSDH